MIGKMIENARKNYGMTKTELSKATDINIGHLTHIEKGDRNPSHTALKRICKALNTPYMPLMFTYDKELSEEQESYNATKYISYNKIVAFNEIGGFIDCPSSMPSAAFAVKIKDDSMEPTFEKNSFVYVELNSALDTKDYGLFSLNDKTLIRKFYTKKGKIFLRADNKDFEEIRVSDSDNFYIIGKILKN